MSLPANHPLNSPPDGVTCQHCSQRPATQWFNTEGGALGMSHGMAEAWCEQCVLETQIAFIEAAQQRLPGLQERLAQLTAA